MRARSMRMCCELQCDKLRLLSTRPAPLQPRIQPAPPPPTCVHEHLLHREAGDQRVKLLHIACVGGGGASVLGQTRGSVKRVNRGGGAAAWAVNRCSGCCEPDGKALLH